MTISLALFVWHLFQLGGQGGPSQAFVLQVEIIEGSLPCECFQAEGTINSSLQESNTVKKQKDQCASAEEVR